MGLNADLNHRFTLNNEATLNFNLLVFYNKVKHPLRLLEVSSNQFAYRQPDDYLDTQGAELGLVWRWKDFKYFFGYTHADVEEHMTTSVKTSSLMPKNNIGCNFLSGLELWFIFHTKSELLLNFTIDPLLSK